MIRFMWISLVTILSMSLGCNSAPETGIVQGSVSLDGSPVSSGEINFYAPLSGIVVVGKIGGSGTYNIVEPVPVGTYKVFISPPIPEQLPPGQPIVKIKFNVPKAYQDMTSTTLSATIVAGKNEIPFSISSK
jgi:hypothetical protein